MVTSLSQSSNPSVPPWGTSGARWGAGGGGAAAGVPSVRGPQPGGAEGGPGECWEGGEGGGLSSGCGGC